MCILFDIWTASFSLTFRIILLCICQVDQNSYKIFLSNISYLIYTHNARDFAFRIRIIRDRQEQMCTDGCRVANLQLQSGVLANVLRRYRDLGASSCLLMHLSLPLPTPLLFLSIYRVHTWLLACITQSTRYVSACVYVTYARAHFSLLITDHSFETLSPQSINIL